jgi:hypothetical protein
MISTTQNRWAARPFTRGSARGSLLLLYSFLDAALRAAERVSDLRGSHTSLNLV